MKIFPALILFVILNNTCFGQDTSFFDSNWKASTKIKAVYYRVNKKKADKWLRNDYYINRNQIQMKGVYASLNPEIKEGYFEWYYNDGKLKHKGSYVNNLPVGQHLWYNANGMPDAIENYKNGKYEGNYEEYHTNGKLSTKTNFVNGLQSGWTIHYREDGLKHSEGNFKSGNRDGEWKYYDENGKILGRDTFKTEYRIKEANLFIQLPNDSWRLPPKSASNPIQYIFKRDSVIDDQGRHIIPAIMVWFTDAKDCNKDVRLFEKDKLNNLLNSGLKIDQTILPGDNDYPLTYKNGIFYKASYTSEGVNHLMYLIYFINKDNIGVQVALDMTNNIAPKYEPEFWITIHSLRELE